MKLISVMFSAGSRDGLFLLSGSPPAALHVPRRAPHSYPANTWTVVCSMVKRPSWSCLRQQDPTALLCCFRHCIIACPSMPRSAKCALLSSVVCCKLLLFIVHICGSGTSANSRFGLVLFCLLVSPMQRLLLFLIQPTTVFEWESGCLQSRGAKLLSAMEWLRV